MRYTPAHAIASSFLILIIACGTLAESADDRDKPPESRFEMVSLISTALPDGCYMQFTLLPDSRIVLVEKFGAVRLVKPDGTVTLAAHLPVYAVENGPNAEDGLIGIAADPGFASTHWLYLLYAVKGEASKQQLSRFTLAGDALDLASEKVLLTIPNCRTVVGHCGGGLSFANDHLYISTGDNTTPFESDGFTPLDPRSDGRDARATAANSMDLRGKILRIHPKPDGTYDIPKGNLFPPGTPNTRPEIYVMGCRNPFRHFADPVTGFLYWGEVGPDAGNDSERGPRGHDEFNQARGPGFFGWPLFVADNKAYAAYDFATRKLGTRFDPKHPINDSPRNTGIKELPPAQPAFIYYPYAASREFPELGTGGRCAMAGPVYHFDAASTAPDKFPAYYDNCWFIYEWMRNWIKVVHLDAKGNRTAIEDFMPSAKLSKPMDMKFGPDGALYLLEFGSNWWRNADAKLVKISFAGGNHAPIAKAGADKTVGKDPLTVAFSSAGSYDKDEGDVITYAWSFTGDKVESTQPNPTFTFTKPGDYLAKLTVTDKGGKTGVATVRVQVGNARPVVTIREPKPGSFFSWGQKLAFKVAVSDDEDGSTDQGTIAADAVKITAVYDDQSEQTAGVAERGPVASAGHEHGRNLAKGSDCLACHQLQAQSVGPAFSAIADKYRGDAAALDRLAQKVIDGGAGVWGVMAMAPHPQHSKDQTREMVGWILSLGEGAISGTAGTITVIPRPAQNDQGEYVITATYTDRGATAKDGTAIGAQTGSASVRLRSRQVRAAAADLVHDAKPEPCADVGGGDSIAYIRNGSHIAFKNLDLDGTAKATYRVASAGGGGTITVHLDSATGPTIGTATVTPTGGWQKWVDVDGTITDPGGAHQLFLVFTGPDGDGLFNLNWIHFHARND